MKKRSRVLLIAALLVLGVVVLGGLYTISQFQPVSQTPTPTRFSVPKGQGVITIADRLLKDKLIRNSLVFRLVVRQQNLGNKIQAGSFELSPHMTPQEIAYALTQGTNDLWITIPEGWRREEIGEYLDNQELDEFSLDQFMVLTAGLEGQLFPDTYLIPKLVTTQSIVELLTTTFKQKVTEGLSQEIESSPHSIKEILTMASLVEREAKTFEQMRYVAGILWNRLDINMALQVDATLQYIKGYNSQTGDWWGTPLAADKKIQSSFNTYLNPGLPPHPIANPGLNAIKAALQPQDSDYLFYIHDSQGKMHFATSIEEHNANVNTYLR